MNPPEELLKESIRLYQEMLGKTRAVKDSASSADPQRLTHLSEELTKLQEQLAQTDQELISCFKHDPKLPHTPLNQERIALIQELVELTDSLLPSLKGVMAIQREELKKIAAGRKVMSGYRSNLDKRGGLVNTSK